MPARLLEHLISRGLLSVEKASAMLEAQRESGGGLDTPLLEQGALSESELLRAISEVASQRVIDLWDFEMNREAASLIPPKIADRFGLIPLSVEGNAVHVVCTYPIPSAELEEISFLLNKRLELWIGLEVRIRGWMSALYGMPLSSRFASLIERLGSHRSDRTEKKKTTAFTEETTLEESLTRDLIDRLARSFVDEPIPVEGKSSGERATPKIAAADAADSADRLLEHALENPNDPPPASIGLNPGPSPSKLPDPADGAVRVRRYGDWDPHAIPDWNLSQARAVLKQATKDRDQIIELSLQFARRTFDFTAVFAVLRGAATLWETRGERAEHRRSGQHVIPIDAPSVFRTVCMTRRSYVGPLPPDALTRGFLEQLGRSPRTIFLFPVEVGGRLVAIFYGDCASRPMSRRRLADFILFCQDLPAAFEELILLRRGLLQGANRRGEHALSESIAKVVWTPDEGGSGIAPVKAASAASATAGHQLPPDFAALLRGLTGPDPEERSSALAQLARFPQAAADQLILHFPGPSGWARLPVFDLPETEELGPIPAALSYLGRPAARALAPLLDSDNGDTRYFALLTAGSLPHPELVNGILRGLFAVEPEISSAARAAATAFRRHPAFEKALRHIRQELAATDPLRRSLAACALGVLHDRDSIDGLIGLTGSEDQACAEAAAGALREITGASFGLRTREWRMWWADNREKTRAEWLVAALGSRHLGPRLSAIKELSKAFKDNLGYFADAPLHERDQAIHRWRSLISDPARTRNVEL